jgi:hypothetical protein
MTACFVVGQVYGTEIEDMCRSIQQTREQIEAQELLEGTNRILVKEKEAEQEVGQEAELAELRQIQKEISQKVNKLYADLVTIQAKFIPQYEALSEDATVNGIPAKEFYKGEYEEAVGLVPYAHSFQEAVRANAGDYSTE